MLSQWRRNMIAMRGTIYLANDAGRSLRRKSAAVRTGDVLYCSGDFASGDPIHIAFLGSDGGQYVIATGIARFGGAALRQKLGPPLADAHARVRDATDDSVMVRQEDLRLLWPPQG
jgi:glutamate 5-kinase